jgi:ATP-dependent DNA helicase RecG
MVSQSPLWSTPIQFAKGVGPQRARLLEKLGILTVEDAFWFVPWRYDDRLEILPIGNILPGMKTNILGRVERCRVNTTSRRRLLVVTMTVRDETGVMECVFFNQRPYGHVARRRPANDYPAGAATARDAQRAGAS